jgi:uncharacterized protein (DUF58 family)
MFGKRKTRLTADGWYYLIIMGFLLAGALLRDINLLLAVFGLMVAAFVGHWRHCVVSLGRLKLQRRLPHRVAAGDPLVVELVANNGRRRGTSWAVVVEDILRREQEPDSALAVKAVFPRLAPREDVTQTYQGRLTRRGRYRFGPLKATTRFPLGLVRRTVVLDVEQSLLVVPRQGRLTEGWRQRERLLAHGSRRVPHRQGASGDFHSLRPYRAGDSRHLIHWRTSARQGQLMVRQFERQETHDLAVFLDLWQPASPNPRQLETVELAVSLAATILADRCRQGGIRLLLAVTGAQPRYAAGTASAALLDDLMEVLAVAEASPADGLGDLLGRGLEEMPPQADGVLISTRETQVTDGPRFAFLATHARQRSQMERMLVVNVSRDEWLEYFEP